MWKVSCEFRSSVLTPVSFLFWGVFVQPGASQDGGVVAACAASGSGGANARPVMSGVTRQWFQNTAVNKVKVSRFAGRSFVFMGWAVHG